MSTATAVKERQILFSGPMVRAILDGRKTQTRRAVKFREFHPSDTPGYDWTFRGTRRGSPRSGTWQDLRHAQLLDLCPYGKPGDQLWVREGWANSVTAKGVCCVAFRADNSGRLLLCHDEGEGDEAGLGGPAEPWLELVKWKPSIHMPRWASRLTLEVTEVRVQRLQDISENDAIAEGAQCAGFPASLSNRGAFAKLWDKINGSEGYCHWGANPWVWAVSFKVCG